MIEGPRPISYIVFALLAALLLAFRLRRMRQGRPLRLERLWVVPAIMAGVVCVALAQMPPRADDWPWLAGALLVGAAIGWARGAMMAITVDPQTHDMNMRASPAALLLILGLFALRAVLRTGLANAPSAWHLSAVRITDSLLLMAAGAVCVQRLEMWIRGRRLLAEARSASASG